MKKTVSVALCVLFALLLGAGMLPAFAASSVTVTLSTDASSYREGNTVVVSARMTGVTGAGGVASAELDLSYDQTKLTFASVSIGGGKPAGDLKHNVAGGKVKLVYFDARGGEGGFSSDGLLATIRFTVKQGATSGASSFSATADGFGNKNAEAIGATVRGCSINFLPPLSNENNLLSLIVNNAPISPAFNSAITQYTASVEFAVSKLDLSAVPKEPSARIAVNNPELTPGGTTRVSITVTAPSGVTKTYTITVARAQDPDYVPEGENSLAQLSVEGFLLSPAFNPTTLEYVVWLPFETDAVTVSALPLDEKAVVDIAGETDLVAGMDNLITIVCTAENGNSLTYSIVAKRAAAHGATNGGDTETTTEETTAFEPAPAEATDNGAANIWLAILIGAIALTVGVGIGYYGLPMLLTRIFGEPIE